MSLPAEIGAWLAPGDVKHREKVWPGLRLHFVTGAEDEWFDRVYAILHREFASRNELETREVLTTRLASVRTSADGSCRLIYRQCVVIDEETGNIAAVRDHTIMLPGGPEDPLVAVHLSHVVVEAAWRRTGLAAWMRAIPAWDAAAHAVVENPEIDLVAEMEFPNPDAPGTLARLAAYGRAGFRKVDPEKVPYIQPDFRSFEEIDRTGGPRPVPLTLILRRVGREDDTHISGAEARRLMNALYAMYGAEFRARDMEPCLEAAEKVPAGLVDLIPPLETT